MQTPQIKTLAGGLTTAAVLCYFSLSNQDCRTDEDYFHEADLQQVSQYYDPNPYYKIFIDEYHLDNQIEIIHKFVSILMEESQNLNPEFSKAVDKHFWNLI